MLRGSIIQTISCMTLTKVIGNNVVLFVRSKDTMKLIMTWLFDYLIYKRNEFVFGYFFWMLIFFLFSFLSRQCLMWMMKDIVDNQKPCLTVSLLTVNLLDEQNDGDNCFLLIFLLNHLICLLENILFTFFHHFLLFIFP